MLNVLPKYCSKLGHIMITIITFLITILQKQIICRYANEKPERTDQIEEKLNFLRLPIPL